MREAFAVLLILLPVVGGAATCEPGYYPKDGVCTICPQRYMCPDGDRQIWCDWKVGLYADGTGNTQCSECPPALNGGRIWHAGEGGREQCREEWNIFWPSGAYGFFSCAYGVDGYLIGKGVGGSKCMVDVTVCPAGYVAKSDSWYRPNATGQRYWVDFYEEAFVEPCIPAGIGYYSPADTTVRAACPDGTSTHIDIAASADECLPLCAAGATHLHAGKYMFNLWPVRYSTPALNIRMLDGDICYVTLQPGQSAGGINLKYNNVIYHTVN